MRVNYFVFLVAATLATSINGLSIADTSVQVNNNVATNSNPTIANEESAGRFLKGNEKTIQDNVEDEERAGISSNITKLKNMMKKIPIKIGDKYYKLVVSYWERHPKLRAHANM